MLAPGYPLAVDYVSASNLVEARTAYPSLVCAVASGFHYLPAFCRLRAILFDHLKNTDGSASLRSVSLSAISSQSYFGKQINSTWQSDVSSGGGVLSQLGAPLLDAAIGLFRQVSKSDNQGETVTNVTVQGHTAQLLDDQSNSESSGSRLWPRTAEDACWVQVDIKRRMKKSDKSKSIFKQSVISLDIVTTDTFDENDDDDPVLTVTALADKSLKIKTDGRSLWISSRDDDNKLRHIEYPESQKSEITESKQRSLLKESISHFADLIAFELLSYSTNNPSNGNSNLDGAVIFSNVLHGLLKSNRIVDFNIALVTQKMIDTVRSSFQATPVALEESNSLPTEVSPSANHISWSQFL